MLGDLPRFDRDGGGGARVWREGGDRDLSLVKGLSRSPLSRRCQGGSLSLSRSLPSLRLLESKRYLPAVEGGGEGDLRLNVEAGGGDRLRSGGLIAEGGGTGDVI